MGYREFRQQLTEFQRRLHELPDAGEALAPEQGAALAILTEALHRSLEQLGMTDTELARQDEALQAAAATAQQEKQRYQQLFDLAPDAYLVTNRDGVIQQANRAAAQWLNVPQKFLMGKPLAVFTEKGYRSVLFASVRTVEGAQPFEMTVRFHPRASPPFFASVKVSTLPAHTADEPPSLLWLIHDTTRQKEAESLVRRSRHRLEILHQIDQAVLAAKSVKEIADITLPLLPRILPCQQAGVVLHDVESKQSTLLSSNSAEAVRKSIFQREAQTTARFVWEESYRQGTPYTVDDVVALPTPLPPFVEKLAAEGFRSYVSMPIISHNTLLGSLAVASIEPFVFSTEETDILRQVATSLAIAMRNTQLFDEVSLHRQQLQDFSRRLMAMQERERKMIAQELHDEIGQVLTYLTVSLSLLEKQADQPEAVVAKTQELRQVVHHSQEQLHQLAVNLRPVALDHIGLEDALQQHVEWVNQRYPLRADFQAVGLDGVQWPSDVATALYRIVQEALTNSIRHAQARQVNVVVERHGGSILVIIEDDGVGFNVEEQMNASLGLVGMRERAEMMGGKLTIDSRAGVGTSIFVRIPLLNGKPEAAGTTQDTPET